MSSGTSSQLVPAPQSQFSAWWRSTAIEWASACCSCGQVAVDLAVGPEVAAQRARAGRPARSRAWRSRRPAGRRSRSAPAARARPTPAARVVRARQCQRRAESRSSSRSSRLAQVPAAGVDRDDELGVERAVVGRQLGQLRAPRGACRAPRRCQTASTTAGSSRRLGHLGQGVLQLAAHARGSARRPSTATGPCGATSAQT